MSPGAPLTPCSACFGIPATRQSWSETCAYACLIRPLLSEWLGCYPWQAMLPRDIITLLDVQADSTSRAQNAQHSVHSPLRMPVKRAGPSISAGAPSPKRRALEARDPAVETVRTSIKEAFEAYKQLVASAEGDPAEAAYQKLCDLSQGRTSTTHS